MFLAKLFPHPQQFNGSEYKVNIKEFFSPKVPGVASRILDLSILLLLLPFNSLLN